MEQYDWIVGHLHGRFVLVERSYKRCWALRIGDVFEVWAGSRWQQVMFKSGGCRGRYLETSEGCRTRLAVCMKARRLV